MGAEEMVLRGGNILGYQPLRAHICPKSLWRVQSPTLVRCRHLAFYDRPQEIETLESVFGIFAMLIDDCAKRFMHRDCPARILEAAGDAQRQTAACMPVERLMAHQQGGKFVEGLGA